MDSPDAVYSFIDMIKQFGHLMRQLNEKFYFYMHIETYISWAVVFLIWWFHHLLTKYFQGNLTNFQLVKLVGLYMLVLAAITVSYADFGKITEANQHQNAFIVMLVMTLILVVGLAWASDRGTLGKWLLWILYVPIALLILSNGRILEERFDFLKSLLPRTDIEAVSLPGEIDTLRVGGVLDKKLIERIENIINGHRAVRESSLVGHLDEDNFIKPYAFVVLKPTHIASEGLKEDILYHVSEIIRKNRITPDMYPYWIEFTTKEKLPRPGKGSDHQLKIERILDGHRKVLESAVVTDEGKTTAYVVLEEGLSPSQELGRELLGFVLEGIRNHNRISPFLEPKWVEFIDKDDVPRTAEGINRVKLQKKVKNWSELFPGELPKKSGE